MSSRGTDGRSLDPHGSYHFHTGRPLTRRSGYDETVVATLPGSAVEAFAGVGNTFTMGSLQPGERVVDLGSGGGFDCFIAAGQVGTEGRVIGVEMTEEMLGRSRAAAMAMGLHSVEFRRGVIEALPIGDGGPTLSCRRPALRRLAYARAERPGG